jgi:hypothetical protein
LRHGEGDGGEAAYMVSMNDRFRKIAEDLEKKCAALLAMESVIANDVPKDTPIGGIYLFSEEQEDLYVGRTKRRLDKRIKSHFGTSLDCPFAWRLAREKTGKMATYKKHEGSRKLLLTDSLFKDEYEHAKKRIRGMKVRYVHEPDPTTQALLEIYVSIATGAKHNDFDTH